MANSYLDLDAQLRWHLTYNHYPPVPLSMLHVCHQAIDAIIADDPDIEIDLPDGITYKGGDSAPAWALAENYHLDTFITTPEEASQ
jgi:hypothetical protein